MEAKVAVTVSQTNALAPRDLLIKNTSSQPSPSNTVTTAQDAVGETISASPQTPPEMLSQELASNYIYKGGNAFLLRKDQACQGKNPFLPLNSIETYSSITQKSHERGLATFPHTPPSLNVTAQEQASRCTYKGRNHFMVQNGVGTPPPFPRTNVQSPSESIKISDQNTLEQAAMASPPCTPSTTESLLTSITSQGIWQNTKGSPLPEHTLPAVHNFIQLAFQTVQKSNQPQLPATMVHHAFPSTFVVTPLSPQTNLPSPFSSLQKAATTSPVMTQELPKPQTSNTSTSKQTMTTTEAPVSVNGQTPSPSKINNTPTTVSPAKTIYNKSLPGSSKSRLTQKSPEERTVLVAERRQSPKSGHAENQRKEKSTTLSAKTQSSKVLQKCNTESNTGHISSLVTQTFREFQRDRVKCPQKEGQNSQSNEASKSYVRNWRVRAPNDEEEEIDPKRRVLVSGFPAYTQSHDLIRVLSKIGKSQVDSCRNRLAVVTFETEIEAKEALKASEEINIYGEYVEILPYTNPKHVDSLYKEYKKVIATQKGQDITMPDKVDLSGDFYQQLENIQNAVRLTPEQAMAVNNLYNDLELVLQQEWPGCVAIPFGSIPTGLGIKSSDADCYVDLPAALRARGAATFVVKARRLLQQYPRVFTHLVSIPRANTPIVKFRHVPSGFHCDVNAKTPLGAQNSKLIKLLFEQDPRLQPLAILIKYWAKVHDLSGTGRLTNYALTMMVIFYLQQPEVGILPPVEKLQRDLDTAYIVDFWNAGFSTRKLPPTVNKSAVHDILGSFFQFYDKFDFDNEVVCPYYGRSVRKNAFILHETLPKEFMRYVHNVEDNLTGPLRHGTAFCVQDPFEQSHNVASSVVGKLAAEIRAYIKFAADAYGVDRDNGCRNFLRTILLQKPKLRQDRITASTLLHVIPRVMGEMTDPDWRGRLREIVIDVVFEKILRVTLTRPKSEDEAKMRQRRSKQDRETYSGATRKPVWQRNKYSADPIPLTLQSPQTLIALQSALTDEILSGPLETPLQFKIELCFREEPRCFNISFKMLEGNIDSFRQFVIFLHTSVLDWIRVLLKPYQAPVNEELLESLAANTSKRNLAKKECRIKFKREPRPALPPRLVVDNADTITESLATVALEPSSDSGVSDRIPPTKSRID